MSIIVFDTETTGLLAPSAAGINYQPYLIDLYCIKLSMDLNLIDTLSIRMKPPISIPLEASKVNGITDDMVTECFPFAYWYPMIGEFFTGSRILVGHNSSYDKSVLHWELTRLGKQLNFPWSVREIDTLEICSQQLGHRLNLTDLHLWLFNEGFDAAHTADVDCKITHKCFIEMVGRGMVEL
jgi:DNA polymerase III epsilon subunit-like protein